MFKKLRDKITEEVKQSAERFPVNIQQFAQFSPISDESKTVEGPSNAEKLKNDDALLVDVSDIKPAGYNSDLFSIDEDNEGSPSQGEFHVVELNHENSTPKDHAILPANILEGTFPGTPTGGMSRNRRNSASSTVSDASSFFPIYEMPGLSTSVLHSDLESCASEWEDSSSVDKLSNDAVYQAYLRMRQRYQKYKGRYADMLRVNKEHEREVEKMRDVLAKTQDKSVRRISELREQCTLEQQAKAHLEQELRSDLEERDHKIAALMTKVKLIQEGYLDEIKLNSLSSPCSDAEKTSPATSLTPIYPQGETNDTLSNNGDGDDVSVISFGSVSTAPTNLESDELIDRLKADITKYKSLLSRCFDTLRSNKKKVADLTRQNTETYEQLQEQLKHINVLKTEHSKELQSLRMAIESSALSMAETKQQFFNELQTKELEVEHYKAKVNQIQNNTLNEPAGADTNEDCQLDLKNNSTECSIDLEVVQDHDDVNLAASSQGSQLPGEESQFDVLLAARNAIIDELKQENEQIRIKMSEQESNLNEKSHELEKLTEQSNFIENKVSYSFLSLP